MPLPAVASLLFWLCATFCLADPALAGSALTDPDLTDPELTGQAGQQKERPAATGWQACGFYLAPRFLYQWQNHIERMTVTVNGFSAGDGNFYSQANAGAALAIGYDLWPEYKWPLRAEFELALRGNSHYSRQASHQAGRHSESFKCLYNATTLLASFYYDHHNETSLVPYLMAGAGLAFVYADFDYRARGGTEEYRASGSQTFTNFAWTAGSGIVWQFSERLGIDLGYRYLNLGTVEFSGMAKFGPAVARYSAEDLGSMHEISLGLRFCF